MTAANTPERRAEIVAEIARRFPSFGSAIRLKSLVFAPRVPIAEVVAAVLELVEQADAVTCEHCGNPLAAHPIVFDSPDGQAPFRCDRSERFVGQADAASGDAHV